MPEIEVREIRENVMGLFANQQIEKGNIILMLRGNKLSTPTKTSIQIGDKQHLEDPKGGFINHHCNPNAEINIHSSFVGSNPFSRSETNTTALVVAKKTISKGDEITFNYETTEEKLAFPFLCDCHGRLIE